MTVTTVETKDSTEMDMSMELIKPTILVVDDQPENIDVLSNILRMDYKVKAAINGEKAVQIVEQKDAPDLILLDIMMPGIDGYEVCARLKENEKTRNIPVIFVSALQNVDDRVKAFTSGGVDYITKPVQPEEVKARVRAHIQLKMMQQQLRMANDELENRVRERTVEVETAYHELHESFKQIVESENKYRSLLDAAPDAVILIDAEGSIEMANPEACRMFGYSTDELVGKEVAMLITEDETKHDCLVQDYLKNSQMPGPTKNKRMYAVRQDKTKFPVDVSFSPLETNGGMKVIVDIRDISEREQLYAQLQQAQKMEAIGHLTGGIAHDFNNMLASILGFNQLALEISNDIDNEKLNEYLQEVNVAGERARDLIAQMLSFSRRGKTKEYLPFDLSVLVKEVVSMLRPMMPSSIEINYAADSDVPMVNADPVKIHQVLMNLCINSRDALDGRGSISLQLKHIEKADGVCSSCHSTVEGGFVVIIITDNGSGIEPEHIGKIFDPFYTTKAVGKGTGMGLSVVHGIMHDHFGHIILDSEPGKGTQFQLLFPLEMKQNEEIES